MNEAETRAEHIDPALRAAGWGVVDGSRILREYPITLGRLEGQGRRAKPLLADYVLVYRNRMLAVVEAKAWAKPLTEGLGQAKNYATRLAARVAFSTNGRGIYGADMQSGAEGERDRYPTPDELWKVAFPAVESPSDAWRDRFAAVPFEDKGGFFRPRYYQDIAIEKVLEAVADDKTRILLTLATGTGKTFIAFQDRLEALSGSMEPQRRADAPPAHPVPRRPQHSRRSGVQRDFSAFPEDAMVSIAPGDIKKNGARVPTNGNVFFTIFQTFLSGPRRAASLPPTSANTRRTSSTSS